MIDGRKCIVFDGYDLVGERLRFNSVVNEGVRHVALLAALRCWPVVGEPAVLPLEESRLLGKRFCWGPSLPFTTTGSPLPRNTGSMIV